MRSLKGQFFTQVIKSVNLQFDKLFRWADGTNDSLTKRLMFQVLFFFITSCKILCKIPFNLFLFFNKISKMKIKSFECPKSIRDMRKKYLERQTLGQQVVCPIGPVHKAAYYIVDCQILRVGFKSVNFWVSWYLSSF